MKTKCSFLYNTSGSMAITAAISMGVFFAFANTSLTIGQAYNKQQNMQHAADSAALAAAVEYSGSKSTELATDAALKYYHANYAVPMEKQDSFQTQVDSTQSDSSKMTLLDFIRTLLGIKIEQEKEKNKPVYAANSGQLEREAIQIDENEGTVTVYPLHHSTEDAFYRKKTLKPRAYSKAVLPDDNAGKPLEVSLVLDVTESMSEHGKMGAMRKSAKNLVDAVLEGNKNASVAIVPFTIHVRLDAEKGYDKWLNKDFYDRFKRAAELNAHDHGGAETWSGCLVNNTSPADTMDYSWQEKPLLPWNRALPVVDQYFSYGERPIAKAKEQHYRSHANANSLLHLASERYTYTPPPPAPPSPPPVAEATPKPAPAPAPPPKPKLSQFPWMNSGCSLPAIVPLSNDGKSLEQHINRISGSGYGDSKNGMSGTIGSVGMLWGWRTLSPKWQNEWVDAIPDAPASYAKSVKAMVFLTDGVNTMPGTINKNDSFSYSAYGYGTDEVKCCQRGKFGAKNIGLNDSKLKPYVERYDWKKYDINAESYDDADVALDEKLKQTCDNIKQHSNISLYTIGYGDFGSGERGQAARNLLKYCASQPENYFAPGGNAQLEEVFTKISAGVLEMSRPTVRLVE